MVARGWIWGALLCAGVTSACGGGDDAGVFVTLKTDLVPCIEFQSVTTELFDAVPRDVETSRRFAVHSARCDGEYAGGVRVADLDAAPGNRSIRVTLRDHRGASVAKRIVRVAVARGRRTSSTVVVTRDCRGIECPDGRNCVRGACVAVDCSPEMPDACGPRECTTDAMCMPAAACAVGMCNLEEGSCLSAPGACPPGQWCNPDVGCEALPTFPDAGPPDAGPAPIDAGPREPDGGPLPPVDTGPVPDLVAPAVTIVEPIGDPAPTAYDAAAVVPFLYTCSDGALGSGCRPETLRCFVDGSEVSCDPMSPAVDAFRFGSHTLEIRVSDYAGNEGSDAASFTVTRCARELQFPRRRSGAFVRGECCAGLTDAVYRDGLLYSGRSDGSCRPPSDHVAGLFERTFDGIPCQPGLSEAGALGGGCTGAVARRVCLSSIDQARAYCGDDDPMGRTWTPMHTRIGEGWHPTTCQPGFTSSSSVLMQRAGADDVCWGTVDQAHDGWSLSAGESCDGVTTRWCRADAPIPGLECVCSSGPDPYADDGRG